MLSILEIVNLLKKGVGGSFYPLAFPSSASDAGSQITIYSSTPVVGEVGRINVQIITRDVHPSLAESKANEIRSYLNDRTDFLLDDVQVVYVQSQNITPLYIGTDENERHMFSMNYNFILGV
ncbi:minor capsid protein [Priestia megaterium]|uniref:minor capsid protein n=1 Tax=Priestia megaterium TaxID=1404 RepID=UPI000BF32DB8|nr:minor capsid protein [Priestia megaterium]PFW43797.1 hypothetical protein COL17_26695 [Priestia megaterium]